MTRAEEPVDALICSWGRTVRLVRREWPSILYALALALALAALG